MGSEEEIWGYKRKSEECVLYGTELSWRHGCALGNRRGDRRSSSSRISCYMVASSGTKSEPGDGGIEGRGMDLEPDQRVVESQTPGCR